MKISEVIDKLQEIQEKFGDLDVVNGKGYDITVVTFGFSTACAVIAAEEDRI